MEAQVGGMLELPRERSSGDPCVGPREITPTADFFVTTPAVFARVFALANTLNDAESRVESRVLCG